MIADGERPAAERIQLFTEGPVADGEQSRPAESAVRLYSTPDLQMRILVDHPDAGTRQLRLFEQGLAGGVQLADQARQVAMLGPQALGFVIQVRQVDQREVGSMLLQRFDGTARDPGG